MTRVIAVTNNKGGVGKTHTVFHLAGAFSEVGKRILLIDLDPQSNLSGLFYDGVTMPNIYDVLIDDMPLQRAIHRTNYDGVFIAPSDSRLQKVDALLQNEPDSQIRLADAIRELIVPGDQKPFDLILIDCPPNIGLTTRNALAAADHVIIPIEADKFSIDGLDSLVQVIQTMKRAVNKRLEIAGILVSLYNDRRAIERLYAETLPDKKLPLFETKVKDSSKYREAIAHRQPITHYKPRSEYASAFRALRDELDHVHVN